MAVVQVENVVVPAGHPDGGQRVAAFAGAGLGDDGVAEVVADQRLDPVGEVGQQHRVRRLPGGRWTVVRLDRLEDDPVAVDVQPAAGTVQGDRGELGGGVDVVHRAAQRRGQALPVPDGFAAGLHDHRTDVQPALVLFLGQQFEGAGVAHHKGRVEGVERLHQPVQRLLHGEQAVGAAAAPAAAPFGLEPDDAGEVPARAHHDGGADSPPQHREQPAGIEHGPDDPYALGPVAADRGLVMHEQSGWPVVPELVQAK